MKKKLKFRFLSHPPADLWLIMRGSFLLILLTAIQLSASAGSLSVNANRKVNNLKISQQVKVTGTITDSITGDGLIGVNVLVDETTIGVVTDKNGKYSITVPSITSVLKISYIGYITQKIPINGMSVIDVKLTSDIRALDEVVVVGYGSVRKSDLTGSISSIKMADLVQLPSQRVDQALQGRTSGVYIMNTDGAPGGNTIIRIRGFNSIMGGSMPLVVIDGLQDANINQINPNDIASMEILKDASATAIYGSRGANGVILITTKLGIKGKPVITFGYNLGFQKLAHKRPSMSAADFARITNSNRMLETTSGNIPVPIFTDTQISNLEKNGGTDWQNEVYKIGLVQNSDLAISGATDKLKYMVSLGYLDNEGIMLKTYYNRFSLRTNLTAAITDWMDFGLNHVYTKEKQNSVYDIVNTAQLWAPTEPVYDENGNYSVHTSGYGAAGTWNPVASAEEPIIDNPSYNNNVNVFLNFKILRGLSFKIMGGAGHSNTHNRAFYNNNTSNGKPNNGLGYVNEIVYERYQNTNIITYDNTIGAHHLTFTGVLEQITGEEKGSSLTGKDFLVEQLNFDNIGGAKSVTVNSWHNQRSLLSYMGRVNYSLKDKYLATFSYRADGSSVFGKDNKWGYFPSGSLAWRISQENFLKNSRMVNNLKLRVSYGVTGNQGISPYQSFARLGSSPSGDYDYPLNGQSTTQIGFGVSGVANTGLKWESTAQSDIGVDVGLFTGRLSSTIDVYKKVTKDLLMQMELPGYVGVPGVLSNVGSIENKGIEILIEGDPLVGDFRWNTSFNFTINRNKVLDLGPNKRINAHLASGGLGLYDDFMFLEVGRPFGLMNGWKYLGLWRTEQEAEARSYGQLPGDPHYADIAGADADGNIIPGPDGIVDKYDQTTILNAFPKYTWGFSNLFTYKGVELSFLIICSQGNQLLNPIRIRREQAGEGNDPKILDYWTPENQDTDQPAMYDGKYREDQHLVNTYLLGMNYGETSRFVEDASFIRLKTITLAYSFDQKLLNAIGFAKAKVYFSGTNLLTITKYSGYDPELTDYQGSDASIGVDNGGYPSSKIYSFGIDLTF
jgi:TonB-dependent starch-binding outer membrane protein SusC